MYIFHLIEIWMWPFTWWFFSLSFGCALYDGRWVLNRADMKRHLSFHATWTSLHVPFPLSLSFSHTYILCLCVCRSSTRTLFFLLSPARPAFWTNWNRDDISWNESTAQGKKPKNYYDGFLTILWSKSWHSLCWIEWTAIVNKNHLFEQSFQGKISPILLFGNEYEKLIDGSINEIQL